MESDSADEQLREALADFPAESFRTVSGVGEASLEIKRSEFIGVIAPASSEDEARAVIDEQKQLHPKARHWCTAFVLGPDARTQRSNDDGEPAGTAGAPILDVLTGSGLTDVVAVVTRSLMIPVSARLDYSTADAVRVRAEQHGWKIIDAEYAADVTLHTGVPADAVDEYSRLLADVSAGAAEPVIGTPRYV